jgi:lipoate-protein ligase A
MARDEALLDGERTVLRRTAWREPAVTIGRFQEWRFFDHAGDLRAPVRRITGGGAIHHGDDLTLGLVAVTPSPLLPERAPEAIAARVARALERALSPWFSGARPRGGEFAERAQRSVLDCFARETPFDLVIDAAAGGAEGSTEKIAGLALHRRRGRVLVQASVRRAGRLPSSRDGEVLAAIAEALGATTEAIPDLDEREEERSWRLIERRYANARWNRRIRGDGVGADLGAAADPDGPDEPAVTSPE